MTYAVFVYLIINETSGAPFYFLFRWDVANEKADKMCNFD